MAREWSTQQKAVFEFFRSGTGNGLVQARAGTGKTSVIIEALNYAPEQRILLCAFNKRIADELNARLQNPCAKAQTLHAVGYSIIRRYWEGVRVDDRARPKALTDAVCDGSVPDPIKRLVTKLCSRARGTVPLATHADLVELAEEYDCRPDDEWEADGWGLTEVCGYVLSAMELAASQKPVATGIDYADMIFLPVRNRWLRPQYDLVVADEFQDVGAAQFAIIRGVCTPGGRLVGVGDDRQVIYAWNGIPIDSMERHRVALNATVLGLTATYRCCRRVTRLAAQLVPDFTHGPENPEGTIETLPTIDRMIPLLALGDLVLSRKNAPLAGVAMALLRQRKRVAIAGRDFGSGLIALVKKLATGHAANSVPQFLAKLERWERKEVDRAVAADREDRVDGIRDKAETLRLLATDALSVHQLSSLIDDLFRDAAAGATDVITCSSIHRAKGTQAHRVFVLVDTLYPPIPCGVCRHFHGRAKACFRCGCPETVAPAGRLREEENLAYVAATRSQTALFLVGLKSPWVVESDAPAVAAPPVEVTS